MESALVFRPALPMDRAAILRLSRDIWDGGDYLHYVLDDWLNDSQGLFAVGEFGSRLAVVAKASVQLPGVWWFEGMRVHPDFEGKGFATRMMRYLTEHAVRQGAHLARLVTSSQRLPVHRICSQMGWTKIAEVAPFRAPALPFEGALPFTELSEAEAGEAARQAEDWQDPALFHGLMDLGWEWVQINSTHLALAAKEQRAWWWRGPMGSRQGVLSVWYDEEEHVKDMKIELAACAPGDLPALLQDYRRLAAHLNQPEACANIPVLAGAMAAAEAADYRRTWDKSLYIFEISYLSPR